MKKQNRSSLIIGVLALAVVFSSIGFGIGYFRYSNQLAEENLNRQKQQELLNALLKAQENNIYPRNKEESEVTSYGDTITKDTILIHKVFYTQCQHTIEEREPAQLEFIGLNEQGFKEYITKNMAGSEIESFSKEQIVLRQRQNKVCPEHYLISINQGYIAVYQYGKDGEKQLIDQTEIPIKMLPTVDQEKLQNGILVDTLEDVEQLLEDFSS